MMELLRSLPLPDPGGLLEILVLAVFFYYTILFFQGTRGAAVLSGFVIVLILAIFLTEILHLDALNWLLQRFSVYLAIAVLVIFQPEIRRALAELGKPHVFTNSAGETRLIDEIVGAVVQMAEHKVGALIAIEREIGTRSIQETGTRVESRVSAGLLTSLFTPNTALHDGGVIIANDRLMAAGCLFPLSQTDGLRELGMRHRAALGMSEETDALVLVVSEETGVISVAYKGHLSRGFDDERLRKLLTKVLYRRRRAKSRLSRVKEQLDLSPEAVAKAVEMNVEPEGVDGP